MSSFWKKIRRDFPITRHSICLDHAAGGPMPKPVMEALGLYEKELSEGADLFWLKWIGRREAAREKAARFINAHPDEIAFTTSTSQGMNYVAELLLQEGKILTNTCEFPSSTVPWLWRKANVVWQKPENSVLSLCKTRSLLSPSVKTIVTSFVQYSTGFRQDLETLGKIKGSRYLVVNMTQGLGALAVDVKKWNADFAVGNSYKWMLAGYGGGILYVKRHWLSRFKPQTAGWRSMEDPERMDNRWLGLSKTAARYELGCPGFPSIFAFGAAVDYFNQIGKERIEKRILELTDFAIERLEKSGFEILSSREPGNRSGIVIIRLEHPQRPWKYLLSKKIYVSPRGGGLRFAPHFYNSPEEIEKFIRHLRAAVKPQDR